MEEISKLYNCNVELEYNSEVDKKAIDNENIIDVEHSDEGLITFQYKNSQKDKFAYFYFKE